MAVFDIQQFIDARPLSRLQWLTIGLCFLVTFTDGFDTAVVGFVAPALVAAWHVSPPALKPLLTAGFLGLAIGALVAGLLADRFGRKGVLIAALAVFGGFSLAAAAAPNLDALTLLRFGAGLGLGAAMPNATTLTAEFCPAPRRALLVSLMFSGFTLGSTGGGFVAAALIPWFGWPSVFVVGGAAPLLLALVLALVLPESLQFLALRAERGRAAIVRTLQRIDARLAIDEATRFVTPEPPGRNRFPLGALFEGGLAFGTVMLWTAFFMGLIVIYLVTSWLPTLLGQAGIDVSRAALVGAMFQLGGTLGALAVSWCMDRWNPHLAVAGAYLAGAAMLLVLAREPANLWLLGATVFLVGFCMSGAQSSTQPLAAAYYPTRARATGVSWMLGIGRFGAILGAYLGGVLLGFGWSFQHILGILAIPPVAAGAAIILKHRRALPPQTVTDTPAPGA
ncbi:MFS transporter [Aliidongia dinghuensis]|uniref:MFS transporter n=1 Tax=Aliidongia dinghuensis TaxID=1867774 RepID=A0A8J2YRA7_9PROT|nr:aromatic acid/H+ symport family MFS transporter [Aliidongia dinghuensis]GGF10476.1 MFS transporter [Aliidongia dinghuensis]